MSLLSIENVSVRFGGVTAVDGVSFDVAPGEIVGIIGPNGAGKTSLLNVVSGLLAPSAGRVTLEGRTITGLKPHQVAARGLARTFQTSRLFPGLTVAENLMAGLHLKGRANVFSSGFRTAAMRAEEEALREKAMDALAFVGFLSYADRPGADLSFGEQRIVEIARALIAEPRIVLLDEPAVGLSIHRLGELEALIRRVRDEKAVTLVMIEHVIRLVMAVTDRVVVMDAGRKIADGPPTAVRDDPAVIEAYLGRRAHA